MHDVLLRGAAARAAGAGTGRWARTTPSRAPSYVDEVVLVDQSPIGRTPALEPGHLREGVRRASASCSRPPRDARDRGLTASHFSFNVPGGRCEACAGDGQVRVDMQFLADVYLVCEACGGPALPRRRCWRCATAGKTIDQVLDMTVHEALHFFAGQHRGGAAAQAVRARSASATCGWASRRPRSRAARRSASSWPRTCCGGRASGCSTSSTSPPPACTWATSSELLACFERLLEAGATLLVIEHNMDVVKQRRLGDRPRARGRGGGRPRSLFQGTPEALAEHGRGRTARYLRAALDGAAAPARDVA